MLPLPEQRCHAGGLHPTAARHAANAVAQHSRRGWRIGSPARGVQVDGIVSLAMAAERAEHRPEPVRLLGVL
jgi:hypothetical protein